MFDRKNTLLTAATLFIALAAVIAAAQTPDGSTAQPAGQQVVPPGADPLPVLSRLEQESRSINQDLARLRIDKWKADSSTKRQAESNALSIQRNLTDALPGIIQQVRANPQSLAGNFKLYRNVTALYDVLVSLTESAGAFGAKGEYEAMAPQVAAVEDIRRSYADTLEAMAAHQDAQFAAARAAVAAAAQTPPPPRQIVVDDTPAPTNKNKKTTKKKKPATPAATTPKPPSQ